MKKSILIVEDDPEIVDIYKEMLGTKYSAVYVTDTKEASKALKKKIPDLMILDIILPGKSGDTFYLELKKQPRFKKLKVLCISVLGDTSDFVKNIDMNSDALAKPFEKQQLLDRINVMLG
ncbi:MAG: response regulator [Nanoarchaeota archaeon]|nr:response regulator [Nanoarchaeota archaeon]